MHTRSSSSTAAPATSSGSSGRAAFAMHAIGQVERERAALGRGRYSLFTGDVGVALFLRHLLDGDDRFPTLGPFGAGRSSL